jgi:hypothetical protein
VIARSFGGYGRTFTDAFDNLFVFRQNADNVALANTPEGVMTADD